MEPKKRANPKLRVFIGSSSEGLKLAEYLQAALEEHRTIEAQTWRHGFFTPTMGHLENLEKKASAFDFAVVVLTPDATLTARGATETSARSNLLLEIGFFVGRLGRERTAIVMCEDDEICLPSYLDGVTIHSYPRRQDENRKAEATRLAIDIRDQVEILGPLSVRSAHGEPTAPRFRVFARSDETQFHGHMENLFAGCKEVVLIGTGLNVLSLDPVRSALMKRAAAGECRLELFLADPCSPAVQARLMEEELGKMKPPVGRSGLLKRLESILFEWRQLGEPENINIRLFGHYPTFALLIVDTDYYIYPYGYAQLGNFSPVLHLSSEDDTDRPALQFFRDHHEAVRRDSIDAGQAWQIRENGSDADTSSLIPFALYLVPPQSSPLYRFGSDVLGFDIRNGQASDSRWGRFVGAAADFGFHLTCCDALYFFEEHETRLAMEEIAWVARELSPFELSDMEIKGRFPDSRSVALVPKDESGSLEALHTELVHRVYKRAAASNYSLRRAKPVRDNDLLRASLMIRRYRAPYILQRYRPHFTLLTNVPEDEMNRVVAELQSEFSSRVPERGLFVEKLCCMSLPRPEGAWRIEKEIRLLGS